MVMMVRLRKECRPEMKVKAAVGKKEWNERTRDRERVGDGDGRWERRCWQDHMCVTFFCEGIMENGKWKRDVGGHWGG